jgi:hypothetical protein
MRAGASASVAPVLTALCFVHCAAFAAIAPLVPALTAALDTEYVECIGVGLSAALVPWGVAAWRGSARCTAAWTGGSSAAAALLGMSTNLEAVTQLALASLSILQLASAVQRTRNHRACCGAGCGMLSAAPNPAVTSTRTTAFLATTERIDE